MNSLRLTWLLVVLNLVTASGLFIVAVQHREVLEKTGAGAGLEFELPSIPVYQSGFQSDYSGIIDRPLFDESRRPPEKAAESGKIQPDSQSTNASEFKLVGVVISPENSQALLLKPGSEVKKLEPGNKIDDWQLESINADSVVLVRGAQKAEIKLERKSQKIAKPRVTAKRRASILKKKLAK